MNPRTVLADSLTGSPNADGSPSWCLGCHRTLNESTGFLHADDCRVGALAASVQQADDLRAQVEALELFKMVLGWMVDYEPEMVHRYLMGHHALDPFDLPAFFRAFPATDTDGWLARNGEAMDRAIATLRGAASSHPEGESPAVTMLKAPDGTISFVAGEPPTEGEEGMNDAETILEKCWITDPTGERTFCQWCLYSKPEHNPDAPCFLLQQASEARGAATPTRVDDLRAVLASWQATLSLPPTGNAYVQIARSGLERLVATLAASIQQADDLNRLIDTIDTTLRVSAAEYVPSIRDVFLLIDGYRRAEMKP